MDGLSDIGWLFIEWVIWIGGAVAFALLSGWMLWYRPYRAERAELSTAIAELQAERNRLLEQLQEFERRALSSA